MATAHSSITARYQQPLWGRMDRALRNCFTGSAILGAALLIAVFVAPPPPPQPTSMEQVPERIARLILEKPKPAAPAIRVPEQVTVETPKVETPKPKVKTPPRRRTAKPRVAENQGSQGRQKAQQEVTQNLAQVSGDLDKVLDNISKALPASDESATGKSKPRRRRRSVRAGRTSEQIASVQDAARTAAPDVARSAIESDGISIAAITDLTVQGAPGGGGGSGGGTVRRGGQSELRSNESLLSVVRRYAPGIQFCYDNELKKNPGLRGKLVVSITVLASGAVSEARVVENTLGAPAVTQCVMSQIRGWQFTAIPEGATSFKTPFVFTPPK